jgi:hypothetical protein
MVIRKQEGRRVKSPTFSSDPSPAHTLFQVAVIGTNGEGRP